ncbi:MAG: CRISPR-associated protein Cas4 [bacterium]
MYPEEELLPISALQHLLFCERQCALIHIEHVWEENRLTVEGKNMHERVHEQTSESRPGIRIARGLRLRSLRLGLVGMADVVEFHLVSHISDFKSPPQPFPVEYKRGKPKADHSDEVQLCAQALCLEEMLDVTIPAGALFYGTTHRRQDVNFDEPLRALTIQTAQRLHVLIETGKTPPAQYAPKCDHCSLINVCLPKKLAANQTVARYLAGVLILKSQI